MRDAPLQTETTNPPEAITFERDLKDGELFGFNAGGQIAQTDKSSKEY